MTTIDLYQFGITEDALIDRVVENICEGLLDETMSENFVHTVRNRVNARVQSAVDTAVERISDAHLLPEVERLVSETTFQKTNRWGEPKEPVRTFHEYLEDTAKGWMEEQVNYKGKSRDEDSYNWSGTQTRLAHMIHEHLHHHIGTVVKEALADANKMFAQSLYETCKIKINEVAAQFKVSVSTARQ
jgi:hypothetical protein